MMMVIVGCELLEGLVLLGMGVVIVVLCGYVGLDFVGVQCGVVLLELLGCWVCNFYDYVWCYQCFGVIDEQCVV